MFIPEQNAEQSRAYQVKKIGSHRPTTDRDILDSTWVFQLPPTFNEQQFIYLRLESTSALRLPITFWQIDAFLRTAFIKNVGFGAFYGILLVMLLFNFFIYTVLRDKAYLFYVFYVFFMFLYQFQVHGHSRLIFELPYRLYNAIFWVCLAATFVFSVLFTRHFLQIKPGSGFYKVLTVILAIALLQGVLGAFGYNIWANQLAHLLGLLGPLLIMTIASLRYSQGFRPARYYILAWGVLFSGVIIWALAAYLPGLLSAVDVLLLATASESVLLALALADRVKTLRIRGEALNNRVKRYRDLSMTDGLTGLNNKRSFDRKLIESIKDSLKKKITFSLMVIDIDHFKSYNDTYGHLEGDRVIVRLAQVLQKATSETQCAFRYGGEEFVMILDGFSCDDAIPVAEKIRIKIMNEPFAPTHNESVIVTVSIGIAQFQADDDRESLFERADMALYQAKANGRNCTVCL
ncbi:GGDEF domain-containing protein [bacterium BFN5]|nr:GGDEF domain-containing protein [bacterium BFN5]